MRFDETADSPSTWVSPKIGKAVLVLARLDQEEDLLPVLLEQVVVSIDLVVLGGRDDDANVADPQRVGGEFLEHGSLLRRAEFYYGRVLFRDVAVPIESFRASAKAAWVRCIAPATRD